MSSESLLAAALVCFGFVTPSFAQESDTLSVSMREAVQIASERHPAVSAARLRVAQGEARVVQARSQILPNFSATALRAQRTFNTATFGFDFPTPPGETPIFDPRGEVLGPIRTSDLRGQASQRLFDWGALKRYQAVGATVDLALASGERVVEVVASLAAVAYVRVLRAEGRLGVLQQDLSQAQDLLGISEDLLEAGTGVLVDVTRARARVARVQAQIIGERNGVARSRLDLAQALGVPLTTTFDLTDPLLAPTPSARRDPGPEASVTAALGGRADLLALARRAEVATLGVSAARAEYLPTLSVFADGGWIGREYTSLLPTYSWGLQVSIPIFDGGLKRGRRQEANAVLEEALVLQRDLEIQIDLEVRRALIDLGTAGEQVAAAAASMELSSLEVEQARQSFEAGVVGNANVVDASLRLSTARVMQIDALASYMLAEVELARAKGTLPGNSGQTN